MNLPALREYLKAHPVGLCRKCCEYERDIDKAMVKSLEPLIRELVMAAVADSHLDWTPELREIMDA